MNLTDDAAAISFDAGEEVLVTLGTANVRQASDGQSVTGGRLPSLVIATVERAIQSGSGSRYRLAFTFENEQYVCDAPTEAIEGTV